MPLWISKILPLFLLPLGLSLVFIFFCLLSGRRRFVVLAFFMLWFSSLGIVSQSLWRLLEFPWQRRHFSEAPFADAIVVLSSGLHPAPGPLQMIEWRDPDRFRAGVQLFRYGKAPLLLFTGGVSPFLPGLPPEGQHYLREAESLGVPHSSIAITPPVVNTAEESRAVRTLLSSTQNRVLLVTSAFHMQRSIKLFEKQGLEVVPFPVDFQARGRWSGPLWRDPTQWFPSARYLYSSSIALRELLGRLIYSLR